MIARIRKSMEEKDQGFTLIELLVVMIIIGILAAIAIPVFLSQQKKAAETAAKADVSAISKEIVAYYVDGTAALTVSGSAKAFTITGGTEAIDGKLSDGNTATGSATDAATWCVEVDPSGKVTDAKVWKMDSALGLVQDNC